MTVSRFWANTSTEIRIGKSRGSGRNWATSLGGAVAWTPANLFASSETGAWYDPSDLATLYTDDGVTNVTTDGDLVYRMDDKSGNAWHMVQATVSLRPVYRTGGGLHWLEYDGVDDYLEAPSKTLAFSSGVFVGGHLREGLNNGGGFFFSASAGGAIWDDGNGSAASAGIGGSTATSVDRTSVTTRNQVHDTMGATASVLTVTGITYAASGYLRTHYLGGGGIFGDGNFYGLVMRETTISSGDLALLEDWIAAKSGVTL